MTILGGPLGLAEERLEVEVRGAPARRRPTAPRTRIHIRKSEDGPPDVRVLAARGRLVLTPGLNLARLRCQVRHRKAEVRHVQHGLVQRVAFSTPDRLACTRQRPKYCTQRGAVTVYLTQAHPHLVSSGQAVS